MKYYQELPGLKFPPALIKNLTNIDLSLLDVRDSNVSSPWWYFKQCVRRGDSLNWNLYRHYGLFFRHTGYYDSYNLPEKLQSFVYKILNRDIKDMPEQPTMKLQTIYGGQCIPLHIDPMSTVGLLVPLSNHGDAYTNFYESTEKYNPKSTIDPKKCHLVDRVNVLNYPALIDTTKIHNVTIDPKLHTKTNPRLTLNIKWRQMSFDSVLSYFSKYQ